MFAKSIGTDVELRLVEDRHVPSVYECVRRNIAHLNPWMPWATEPYELAATKAWQQASLNRFANNNGFDAGVFEAGEFKGVIGLHAIDWPNRKTSIGYWLDASLVGRGVMTAACRAVIDHVFGELGLNRVEIRCAPANVRSRRIPQRLGFVEEGVARQVERHGDKYLDLVVYSMLAADWQLKGSEQLRTL